MLLLACFMCAIFTKGQNKYEIQYNIPYIDQTDTSTYRKERCVLDIYYPKESKKTFKTVIWFHGGGLTGGLKHFPKELKECGLAIVAPNYRLSPKAKNPAYTEDAAAAVAWTIAHIAEYGGSPSEVYVAGHSAGGYLSMMLALDKRYLAAYGVDADSIKGYFPISGQAATHYTIRHERNLSTDTPLVDDYAPLNHVRNMKTKLVLITGDRRLELLARYEDNLYLQTVLERAFGMEVPLYELDGFSHDDVVAPGCLLIKKIVTYKKRRTRFGQ